MSARSAGACLTAVLAAAGSLAFATATSAAPKLTLSSGGKTVKATQGSFCLMGVCADKKYPLPIRCSLPARPRAKLIVHTGKPVKELTVTGIESVGGPGGTVFFPWQRSTRPSIPKERFLLRLPKNVGAISAIDTFVRYPGKGDSNTWTGLKTPACSAPGTPS